MKKDLPSHRFKHLTTAPSSLPEPLGCWKLSTNHEKRVTIAPFQTYDHCSIQSNGTTRMLKVIKVQRSPEIFPINNNTIQIQWNKTGIVLDILKKINSALVKTSFPMIIPGLFWENLVIAPENFFHFSMTTSSKHLVRGKFSWKDSHSWTKICFC